MTPAAPDVAAEGLVYVLHKTLVLSGDGEEDIDLPEDDAVATGHNVLMAASAWGTHYVRVRLELWPTEPVPPAGTDRDAWEITQTAAFPFTAPGPLTASTITSGPADPREAVAVQLPVAGLYQVRMYSRGRAEAVRIQLQAQEDYDETMDDQQLADLDARGQGVEQYLFQIWPS